MDTSQATSGLFRLAQDKAAWLSERQSTIARNVANANTPGYGTMDIAPFEDAMEAASLKLAITNPRHLPVDGGTAFRASETAEGENWDGTHALNTVNLEQEMLKAGEVHDAFALGSGVVKSFQRFILTSVRG